MILDSKQCLQQVRRKAFHMLPLSFLVNLQESDLQHWMKKF